jgi:hypothetical protein
MATTADIASEPIRKAVLLAVSAGNGLKVISTEWKLRQVAFMDRALSSETRSAILAALPDLEHTVSEPTPHNPATETFVDRVNDVAVAFPAQGEQRRWY